MPTDEDLCECGTLDPRLCPVPPNEFWMARYHQAALDENEFKD